MIRYRPPRYTYDESIKEEKLFMTKDDLFEYILEEYNSIRPIESPAMTKDDLLISAPITEDASQAFMNHIFAWKETRYVLTKRFGNCEYPTPQAVGYCCIEEDSKDGAVIAKEICKTLSNVMEKVASSDDPLKALEEYHLSVAGNGDPNGLMINENPIPISEPYKFFSVVLKHSYMKYDVILIKAESIEDAWNVFWDNVEDDPCIDTNEICCRKEAWIYQGDGIYKVSAAGMCDEIDITEIDIKKQYNYIHGS